MKKLVGTIDITPTWRALVPMLVALVESGSAEGRAGAIAELYRMADCIDGMRANGDNEG